jgi:hypothetical protein
MQFGGCARVDVSHRKHFQRNTGAWMRDGVGRPECGHHHAAISHL